MGLPLTEAVDITCREVEEYNEDMGNTIDLEVNPVPREEFQLDGRALLVNRNNDPIAAHEGILLIMIAFQCHNPPDV